MSRVEKLVCDECGKERDLTQMYFGRTSDWQEIMINNPHNDYTRIKKDFCSMDCVVAYYQKRKDAPHDQSIG